MIINLTPHPINIGGVIIAPDPRVASEGLGRAQEEHEHVGWVEGGVPLLSIRYHSPALPAPERGVTLIVSLLTYQAAAGRSDLVVPGKFVRDAEGRIIGCEGLARLA